MADLRTKRQHLQSFLLRHSRVFTGRKPWTRAHARWLAELAFDHPAQHLVLREYRQAIEDAEARLERLTRQVAEVVSSWSMAPVVEAYQALRGVALLTAVTFAAEIGDVRRFETRASSWPMSASSPASTRPATGSVEVASRRQGIRQSVACSSRGPGHTASRPA